MYFGGEVYCLTHGSLRSFIANRPVRIKSPKMNDFQRAVATFALSVIEAELNLVGR